MDNIELKGVLLEKEPDPRNYKISQFVPNKDDITDEEFMLNLPKTQIIDDQGQYNDCVGQSFVMAKKILEYNHTNKWIDFDPFVLYGTRYLGDYTGEGMYPIQGAKVLYKEGAFYRRDFNKHQEMPMLKDTVDEWKKINPSKVEEAKKFKITGYSFVNSVSAVKKALKNGMPVSAAYPVYTCFYNTGNDGRVPIPKSDEKIDGYHQMTIVGWTKDNCFIVVNSWGIDCGLKGMYLIPYEYKFDTAIAVSDTITPLTYKCKELSFKIGESKYIVDGEEKEFDVVPYVKDDRTYVSVRFITEALGCSVEWIESTNEVIVRSEEAIIKLQIGSPKITINDKIKYLDVSPEIINDRTMLPIRFISEALNCEVSWNEETQTVTIKAL